MWVLLRVSAVCVPTLLLLHTNAILAAARGLYTDTSAAAVARRLRTAAAAKGLHTAAAARASILPLLLLLWPGASVHAAAVAPAARRLRTVAVAAVAAVARHLHTAAVAAAAAAAAADRRLRTVAAAAENSHQRLGREGPPTV